MSNEQTDIQTSEDAEFVMEDAAPGETATDSGQGRSNAIAWLAVLLSLLAVAGVGYTMFQDWTASDDDATGEIVGRIDDLDRRLDETNASIASVDTRLGQNTHPDYGARIDALQQDIEEQLAILRSLPPRMSNVEDSVASLAGISAGARSTFLLAEAEYYLQIANAQLQFANNPELAALALAMADERVTQLSDPGLTDVRRAIADELQALEGMQKPDLEGASMKLASLARVAESLPIGSSETTSAEVDPDEEQGNLGRAWDSIKDAMSGLVKVTPPDQAKLTLVSPDAEYFLRNNIALQLQSARLALLRGEQAIFEQSLDDASALLNLYFDTSTEQVTSAQLTISEIRNAVFTTTTPDISNSLRLLRQFRTLRETSE